MLFFNQDAILKIKEIDMHSDKIETQDEMEATLEPAANVPSRHEYRVLSEAGLFKNGKQYDQGDIVELDARTASSFLELGEVEPLDNDSGEGE